MDEEVSQVGLAVIADQVPTRPKRAVTKPDWEIMETLEAFELTRCAQDAAEACYRVVDAAYERRSTAVTSPRGRKTMTPPPVRVSTTGGHGDAEDDMTYAEPPRDAYPA